MNNQNNNSLLGLLKYVIRRSISLLAVIILIPCIVVVVLPYAISATGIAVRALYVHEKRICLLAIPLYLFSTWQEFSWQGIPSKRHNKYYIWEGLFQWTIHKPEGK